MLQGDAGGRERIQCERIGDFGKDCTPNDILLDFGKTISCEYTKAFVLDNKYVRAHEEGNIYIHNLDYFNLGKLSSMHPVFDKDVGKGFPSQLIFNALHAKLEVDGEICIDSLDNLLIPFINNKFKENLKNDLNKYLDIAGYLEYVNLKKIEEIIDKQNSIYFENSLFDNFILNKRVQEIFELSYKGSFDYIRRWENSYNNKNYNLNDFNGLYNWVYAGAFKSVFESYSEFEINSLDDWKMFCLILNVLDLI